MSGPPAAPAAAWHALPGDAAAARVGVDPERGLSAAEADARLARHGPNRLPGTPARAAWRRLLAQFRDPLIHVLLAAAALTLAIGDRIDAAVIALVVAANAVIGFVQEGRAERALDAVRELLAARAAALRDGVRHALDAAALVPGDLVLLEAGDRVPADLRLLRVRGLRVVESALTGESAPVDKRETPVEPGAPLAERASMAWAGTLVAAGQARGIVVATGTATEVGRIGALVGGVRPLATPLTRRLERFARRVAIGTVALGALAYAYGRLVAGLPPYELFLAIVGLSVAAIPEGLPAIVTIVLAIGTRTMARRRAVVRRLPAVETLGSVSVICTDKTGTLTRNEMSAVRLVLPGGREVAVSGTGYGPAGDFAEDGRALEPARDPAIAALARCAALCNDARLSAGADGAWRLAGDPTEGALLALAARAGLDAAALARATPRVDELPFESERRIMATLHAPPGGAGEVLLKGAPERVLALCEREAGGAPLDREAWAARVERAAAEGERVLALARRRLPDARARLDDAALGPGFELLGLVGLIDPPREEALAAIADCRRAGIRVKMITGDHAATAAAIGRRLGLAADGALTGEAIDRLDDAGLRRAARSVDVFARTSPEHKLRLVAALQAEGELVAMTGDGVNDAPALAAADIGVAMGGKGTDAAREASDLVLTDDDFATIARAVREGRVVFDNIKKSLLFLLPTNAGEAGTILLAILAGIAAPVTPGQILWVNTVTEITLGLALAFEPAEPDTMARAPRAPGEPLLGGALALRIVHVTLWMIATTFAVHQWQLARGAGAEAARTAAVGMLVVHELLYLFHARHFTASALRRETLVGNPVAIGVAAVLVALQLAFTYAPPMQALFGTAAIDAAAWGAILALGLATFAAVEAEKALWRRAGVARL